MTALIAIAVWLASFFLLGLALSLFGYIGPWEALILAVLATAITVVVVRRRGGAMSRTHS